MSDRHDTDRQFSQNLEAIGQKAQAPAGVSPEMKSRCMETLASRASSRSTRMPMLRRARIFSTVGLAAAIVMAVTLLPWSTGTTVEAAVVLQRLTAQVAGDDLLDVVLDSVGAEGASVDGRVQVGKNAVAGDLKVSVGQQVGMPDIEVDISLGISDAGGWVLIRELKIPDPEIQMMINMFFPSGSETLLILPDEIVEEFAKGKLDKELEEARGLVSGELAKFLKEVLNTDKETGVEIETQRDGTVLMTLRVQDAGSLKSLLEIARDSFPDQFDSEKIEIDDSDVEELVGGTLSVIYDPTTETVRSFSVSDIGEMTGAVTISFRSGDIDPALLDSSRVAGPNTRELDIGALKSMFEGLSHDGKGKDNE